MGVAVDGLGERTAQAGGDRGIDIGVDVDHGRRITAVVPLHGLGVRTGGCHGTSALVGGVIGSSISRT